MDTANGSFKGDTARLEPGSDATKQVDPDARTAGRATATPTQSATSLTHGGLGAGSLAPGDSVPSLDRATRRDSTGEAAQRLREAAPLCCLALLRAPFATLELSPEFVEPDRSDAVLLASTLDTLGVRRFSFVATLCSFPRGCVAVERFGRMRLANLGCSRWRNLNLPRGL